MHNVMHWKHCFCNVVFQRGEGKCLTLPIYREGNCRGEKLSVWGGGGCRRLIKNDMIYVYLTLYSTITLSHIYFPDTTPFSTR